jgi:hypothetical protein
MKAASKEAVTVGRELFRSRPPALSDMGATIGRKAFIRLLFLEQLLLSSTK